MERFKLHSMKRLKNSLSGGPRYRMTFIDMPVLPTDKFQLITGNTKSGAGWVYAVTDFWVGKEVQVEHHNTKSGNTIIDQASLVNE